MTALFRREDALVLGMMISKYIRPPFVVGEYGGSYNYSQGYDWGFVIGGEPSTGAGGGIEGENGKPMVGDKTPNAPNSASISGYGATQDEPGKGFQNGKFGMGGGDNPLLNSISCGGGSGWFGGGSSYVGAGGGGGSGFILSHGSYVPAQYVVADDQFYALTGTEEYEQGVKEGHGACIINGELFPYTGSVQEYVVPQTGYYTIECYGAQGAGLNGTLDYAGGKGGRVKATFELLEGTTLFIYVGAEGSKTSAVRSWNGGGMGLGGAYGGGGATDVRWSKVGDDSWDLNLFDRFIVAGGGGGTGRNTSLGGLNQSLPTNVSPSGSQNESTIETVPSAYVVNDKTKVTVTTTYLVSADAFNEMMRVRLFVDGVDVGFVEKPLIAGGGTDTFVFNFSDIYPENTPDRWAKIEAKVETDVPIIIPPSGLVIRVETEKNSATPENDKPIIYLTRNVFNIDFLTLVDIYRIDIDTHEGNHEGTDNIVDIVVVEDATRLDLISPKPFGAIIEDIDLSDLVDYKRVSVLRVDNNSSEIGFVDAFLIEGGSSELPNLDVFLEDMEIRDYMLIDTSDVATNLALSDTGVLDVSAFSFATVLKVDHHSELNFSDVYLLEGVGGDAPVVDGVIDDINYVDVHYLDLRSPKRTDSLSSVSLGDLFTFSRIQVMYTGDVDLLSMEDVVTITLE